MTADALLVHLRRPITAIGAFLALALLIVALGRSDGDRAQARTAEQSPASAVTAEERASTQALVDRGTRALELGRYDEAIMYLREALASDPDSAVAQNLLGMAHRFRYNALRSRRDKDREIEAFREAVRLDPNYVQALVNLGTSLWWDGQGSEAVGFLTRALALDPYHPDREGIARMVTLAQVQPPPPPAADPPQTAAAPASAEPEETQAPE